MGLFELFWKSDTVMNHLRNKSHLNKNITDNYHY